MLEQKSSAVAPVPIRRRWLRLVLVLLAIVLAVVAALAGVAYRVSRRFTATEPYPESATGLRTVAAQSAVRELVVTADAQASRAAQTMLQRGGSALDAALAAQFVLGLVEPQSSGLGGGAFLLYWDANTKELRAYDGRETAPKASSAGLFMRDGQPLSFPVALLGGRSVGVPGALRMLELAHRQHGRLPWRDAAQPALQLAFAGYRVSARLARLLAMDPVLPTAAATRAAFAPRGKTLTAGAHVTNLAYATALTAIAAQGANALYEGALGRDVAQAVHAARRPTLTRGLANLMLGELGFSPGGEADVPAPGGLSRADLAAYRPLAGDAVCASYRAYRVCGPPPPASGLVVLQALELLERFPMSTYAPLSPEALHLLAEAQRVAFADRDAWLADPAFADVPVAALLDPEYVRARGARIDLQHALPTVQAGAPPGVHSAAVRARSPELPATSHLSIVDRDGNIACMTSSIEFAFGSHVMVDGFLLNNQLTDFSFRPTRDGRPVANAVAPGKRPRSAMTPIVIFERASGRPVAAVGSPGGPAIIGYVLQTIVALLDWKLAPQAAVSLPHVIDRNRETELEDVGWSSSQQRLAAVRALEARGHRVQLGQQNSGLHVIWMAGGKLEAGVDPRREGAAFGD